MNTLRRDKKGHIVTHVEIAPSPHNGLPIKSVADCLQTRPIDHRARLVTVRVELEEGVMAKIDDALKIVFALA